MKWYVLVCVFLTACQTVPESRMYTEIRPCEVAVVSQKDRILFDQWISRMTEQVGKLLEIPRMIRDAKEGDVLITGTCYQERIIHPLVK